MTRILVANANTTEAITLLCAEAARASAAPGTEILPATPRFGPAVISSRAENVIAGHALLELLAEHAGQVQAVVLAVSHDTALEAARQLMPCPVVGMTEAACLAACMLGARFGLLTLGGVETYRELVGRHGLASRLSGLEGVAATPQEAVADPARVEAMVLAAVARLVEGGADAVVRNGSAARPPGAGAAAGRHRLRREDGRGPGGAGPAQGAGGQLGPAGRAAEQRAVPGAGGAAAGIATAALRIPARRWCAIGSNDQPSSPARCRAGRR
jgi:allantoin racemase